MSSRATTIQKSRKDQGKCGNCGVALPVGSAYRYWQPVFRSRYKIIRCMSDGCTPRPSELDQSKKSSILAAQESFSVDDCNTSAEIKEAVDTVAEAVRGVGEEYREAADSWEHGNSALEELADHYEAQADELDSWEPEEDIDGEFSEEEPEEPDAPEDEDDAEAMERYEEEMLEYENELVAYQQAESAHIEALDDAKESAREVVDGIELM